MCLALPAKIKKIKEKHAIVDFGGVQKTISLGILDTVKVGDYVLVHAGFAIGKVSKFEVKNTQKALKDLQKAIC